VTIGIDADKVPAPRHVASILAGALAGTGGWLVGTTSSLSMPLVLLCLLAAVTVTAALDQLLGVLGRRWAGLRPRHRQAVSLPVAVTSVLWLSSAGLALATDPPPPLPDGRCPHPVELRILTSPQLLRSVRELADAYEAWTAGDHGCPRASSYVYAVEPETAVTALGSGWGGTVPREVGPRPDLWLPDSADDVDAALAAAEGAHGDLIDLRADVVGSSPLVLAVAQSVADDAGVRREGLTWMDLLRAAQDAGWAPVRPDPELTLAGELVAAALYGTVDDEAEATARAREIEPRIAQALGDGGYPFHDQESFLCHYRQNGATSTALLIPEQAMVRFNRGDRRDGDGDGDCMAPGGAAGAGLTERLQAFYPADTLTLDYLAVTPVWLGGADTRQARAAADLHRWLTSPPGQGALIDLGLRPPGRELDDRDPLTDAYGVLPAAIPVHETSRPPGPEEVDQARRAHRAAQRPGVVLLALDASGSMSDPVDGQDARYDLARRGIEQAFQLLGEEDQVGLWVFPDRGTGRELVPIARADEPHRGTPRVQVAVEAMAAVAPGGATPLYRTIVDGVAAVGPIGGQVRALVVLTDGENWEPESSRDPATADALEGIGRDAGVRVFVVALGEASCLDDALAGVTRRTGGACIQAEFDGLAGQLVDLFGVLWSGQSDGS
jgi:hypothetical protein